MSELVIGKPRQGETDKAHRCIHELFEEQAEVNPESVAVCYEQERVTYRELNERGNQLAQYLRGQGVGAESVVGICLEPSVEMIVAVLGVLKASGAYLPLDPAYPKERLRYMMGDAGVKIVLSREREAEVLGEVEAKVIRLDEEREGIEECSKEKPEQEGGEENLAYVIYTSGSTGKPKGVEVVHRNIVRLMRETEKWYGFGGGDVWTLYHSYAFDFSVWEIWGALGYGGRLVVVPYWKTRTPEAMYELIVEEGVTVLNQTPSAFKQLMRAEEKKRGEEEGRGERGKGDKLRVVIFGGEALEMKSLRGWVERRGDEKPELVNMYGITETTVHVTYRRVRREDVEGGGGSVIGEEIGDLELYVLDREGEIVPVGVSGELYVGGEGVARGYLGRAEMTAERFVPNGYSREGGARMYRTGDVGKYRSNGEVEYVGRIDEQVKIRGFRIELGEIEEALLSHPAIVESVVVIHEQSPGEKSLLAYAVCRGAAQPSAKELRGHLQTRLPEYMLPSSFVMLDSFPLTQNGKIDKKALPIPESAGSVVHEAYAAPQTFTEEILAGVWGKVLGVEQAGIDDSFFALGGDSIRSIQARAFAGERGVTFSFQQLFRHRTIRALAQEVQYGEPSHSAKERGEPFSLISEQDRFLIEDGIEDAYPMTLLQAGMIFHSEYDPESAIYHDIFSYHLRAPFEETALRAAAQRLVKRHSALRTSFDLGSFSEPMQFVHRTAEIPLTLDDLSYLSDEEQEKAISQWINAEKGRAFDWSRAPLLCFQVHRRSDDTFQFTICFHHVLMDGWSLASLTTELFQSYFSIVEGREDPEDPPLGVTLRDFVEMEQQALKSPEARQFWKDKLSDMSLPKASYWRKPLDKKETGPGVSILPVPVSLEVSEGLKKLARAKSVPLKNVLLAAHLRVIGLMSGQSDVVTGVVSNGRPEERDGERVLGLFLNTLPFRMRLTGGTWEDLVEDTFEGELEMLPYRRYPMQRIREEHGGQLLFDTAFNYTHFHIYDTLQGVADADVRGTIVYERTEFTMLAQFGLNLESGQVQLRIVFDSKEVEREQAEAICDYFARTLDAMSRGPKDRYEMATLLSAGEQRWLEEGWKETRSAPLSSVHEMFERQVERTPDEIAVIFEDRILYREFNARANQLAHYLIELGVRQESRVAICIERSIDMCVAVLATLKAGAAYVPLDPAYPRPRLDYMLADSGASVLLTTRKAIERSADTGIKTICLDGERAQIAKQSEQNPRVEVASESIAYVIYTSGSTGMPKGIALPHLALANLIEWHQRSLLCSARTIQFASLSFDPSFHEMFAAWTTGGSTLVISESLRTDPPGLAEAIDRHRIEKIILPVVMFQQIAQLPAHQTAFPSLREITATGEQLQITEPIKQMMSRLKDCKLHNHYGPAESHVVTAYSFEADVETWATLPPIGKAISNSRVYVLDEHMQAVPRGVAAELFIAGECLARGYVNRPDLTAEKFIPDPFSHCGGERLYKSGDIGRYLPDGNIEYLGRADQQVKLRGYRIEPGEIESLLLDLTGVAEAIAIVNEDEVGDRRLVAYVVADESGADPVTPLEIRAYLRDRVPDYMVPSAVMMMDALPVTPNGKVDRRALPKIERRRTDAVELKAIPGNEIEEGLARVWERVLGVEAVGVGENFFELGGHSLKATQVVNRIKKQYGWHLSLRELFSRPTIKELAEQITKQQSQRRKHSIEKAEQNQYYELSSAQRRVWIVSQQEEGSRAYMIPGAYLIEGAVDEKALRRSFEMIVLRHESLRTRITVVDGEPKQEVGSGEGIEMQVIDLRGDERAEERAADIASIEAREVFNLETGPLARMKLVKIGNQRQAILMTLHHIIADGWSMNVLMREMMALYEANREGRDSALKDLRLQHKDFAEWERSERGQETKEEDRKYWAEKLSGELKAISLGGQKQNGEVGRHRGAVVGVEVSEELTEGMRRAGRERGASLYMVALTGVYALLHRYTGQEDLVIGMPLSGREDEELEGQIGMYLNTVLLRARASGEQTLDELMAQVRETTLEAYEHGGLGYEEVVKLIKVDRRGEGGALLEVVVSMQEKEGVEGEREEVEGVTIREWGTWNGVSKNDLWIGFRERGRGLTGAINYNSEKYDETIVIEIRDRLQKVYRQIVEDARVKVMDIDMDEESYSPSLEENIDIELRV